MTTATETPAQMPDFPACKIIYCILPDDGTDRRMLAELRKEFGVINAGSSTCRGIGVRGTVKAKPGKLPQSRLVKKLYVICPVDHEDEIFDFMFWSANIDKPEMGIMWQQDLTGCSPFELPLDIPDEEAKA